MMLLKITKTPRNVNDLFCFDKRLEECNFAVLMQRRTVFVLMLSWITAYKFIFLT
jgi:hypothetical protein